MDPWPTYPAGGYARVTNVFAVYDGNTASLGLFDPEEAKAIARAYTLGKSHVESITSAAAHVKDRLNEIRPYLITQNPIGDAFGYN